MTARPTHAEQQQALDQQLAELPTVSRWQWLFTPDANWLASVNTVTLREVNAVRMFVLTTLVWNGVALAVTAYALGRCHWLGTLGPDETWTMMHRACEESLATARLLDFSAGLFDSYGILLAAMAGIAAGAMLGKRATDTEHRVRVEEAKKAPVILPGIMTSEHQAQQPPKQEVNVNVGQDAGKAEQPGPGSGDTPAGHWGHTKTDDERGES